jgi:hypothetical protein
MVLRGAPKAILDRNLENLAPFFKLRGENRRSSKTLNGLHVTNEANHVANASITQFQASSSRKSASKSPRNLKNDAEICEFLSALIYSS